VNQLGALEAVLFAAGEPLKVTDLAKALVCDPGDVVELLPALQNLLDEQRRGLQLIQIAGGWQLATRPEYAENVARLLNSGPSKLSRAALETLAIVAYRQPVTQAEIEAVRGVHVGGILKSLVDKRLVVEVGRKAALGRPILYATTPEFLHYFAISDLAELPPLEMEPGESVAEESLGI
jgi:segregation and condensation protein B